LYPPPQVQALMKGLNSRNGSPRKTGNNSTVEEYNIKTSQDHHISPFDTHKNDTITQEPYEKEHASRCDPYQCKL
jgi:hypothetical protein